MKDNTEGIEAQVRQFGDSAHIILPKEWVGKKVKVTLVD